jgi:ABC-type transport system involved in cytochrome c biogenesis permease subunit
MKILKKLVIISYICVILAMMIISLSEKFVGTPYASAHLYGSWWFCSLWIVLTVTGFIYILRNKIASKNILLLHLSFVIILIGALLTHLYSFRGVVHLRVGETSNEYLEEKDGGMRREPLPFSIKLESFDIQKYEGSDAAADYASTITVKEQGKSTRGVVSMNHIFCHDHIRIYQNSYDEDANGSTLCINSDPWGIPVTYTGYVLLFFSLFWMLFNPKGTFRKLLKNPLLRKTAFVFFLCCSTSALKAQTTVLPRPVASHMCEMFMQYNTRICQIQTYAYEFTHKISGGRSYKGCSPEQILTGFIFWGDQWAQEKIIKVKGSELKDYLHLDDYVSVNELFSSNGYILKQLVEEYYRQGCHDALHEQAARLDDKVNLIAELRMGKALNLIQTKSINELYRSANSGNNTRLMQIVDENISKQRTSVAGIPSTIQVEAERINNQVPFATILFIVNLTLGFLAFLVRIRGFKLMLAISFLALTFSLVLRWIISNNIPLSNGYESMLSVAWFVMLFCILFSFLLPTSPSYYLTLFGFLLSGFLLLVSHINQMDPAIGHIMPVLNSPLLSIHVSIIMMSYALLALTFVCDVLGLLMKSQTEMLQLLSRLLLYPAITTMGIGIFVGAIWANISWGTYWSWDPKETWALITFMIYAVVLHTHTLPIFRRPKIYHLYMVLAFLCIIMTYFGVNYVLGGLHSYA